MRRILFYCTVPCICMGLHIKHDIFSKRVLFVYYYRRRQQNRPTFMFKISESSSLHNVRKCILYMMIKQ